MNMRKLALTVAALAVVAVPVAGATTTAAATPDQRFVFELKGARQAAQVAFRQLTPWNISIDKVAKAKSELTRALDHLKSATQAATGAVGASEAEIAGNVRTATNFIALASKDVRKGNYDAARDSVDVALDANSVALAKFGVPLAKEFQGDGDLPRARQHRGLGGVPRAHGQGDRADREGSIGILGRPAANIGEVGAKKSRAVAADHEARDLHAPGAERRVQLRLGQDRQRHHRVRPQSDDEGQRGVCDLLRPQSVEGDEVPREVLVDGRPPLVRRPDDEVSLGASSRRERRGTACRAGPGFSRVSG